jgi:hypothetical protein
VRTTGNNKEDINISYQEGMCDKNEEKRMMKGKGAWHTC